MPITILELYVDEMPSLISEERQMRFEDVLMTNENVKDDVRQKYAKQLQQQMKQQEIKQKSENNKKSAEMRRLQLNLMGIGINEV